MKENPQILVGSAGDERSADAIFLAKELAEALGGTLTVALATVRDPLSVDAQEYMRQVGQIREASASHTRKILGETPFESCHRISTSVSGALASLAVERKADLVVVGSTERGSLGRVFLGSAAEGLVRDGRTPVAVAPVGFHKSSPAGLRTVGVGCDEHPATALALEAAGDLARHSGAELHLISAVSMQSPLIDEIASPLECREIHREKLADVLSRTEQTYIAEGLTARTELVDGEPAEILVERSEGLDLLVLGSRGRGRIASAILGSVSIEVVRHAKCPILVVPLRTSAAGHKESVTADGASDDLQ